MGPGFLLEADALEADFEIVSSMNNELNIGRPIIYLLTDKYSHCIVAFSVSLENNSMIGLTNLMLNLMDSRNEIGQRTQVKDTSDFMPYPFIPSEIRCDRGSDFASNQFEKICQDLNIARTLVEGAKGSMKGLVERSFGIFHTQIAPGLEHAGFIQKRYDSNHAKEACLTLEEAYLLVMMFVAYRNTTPMEGYRLSRKMMMAGVDKSPLSIWNYGVENTIPPNPVTDANRASMMIKLLPTVNVFISRHGVCYKNLYYENPNDNELISQMRLATRNANRKDNKGSKLNSMTVRMDPRSINNLYYEKKGKLQILSIIPSKCGGLRDITWAEYNDYLDMEKAIDSAGREVALINRIKRQNMVESIVNNATTKTYASSKGKSKNRSIERNESNFNGRIQKRLESEEDATAIIQEELEPIVEDKVIEQPSSSLFSPTIPDELRI